ncbi:hypothetical protein [Paracoccus yeei]|uniref:hypothetical protein n=1 Tax=Paracoccus yeei TaxID=147645 RepID=UPI0011AFE3C8|nr:hypothetical protein [Paracoccus yeei]
MSTIYFSNGDTAEVENLNGYDPRTFVVPATAYGTVAKAWQEQATAQFSENGDVYLLKDLQGDLGTAVLKHAREKR